MSAPAFSSVLSSVITALRASSSFTNVRIFDGVEIDQSYPGDAVAVGHDGSLEADEIHAGDFRQEYAPIGAKSKMEDGSLNCFLWSWDGASDVSARRARAYALLASCEQAIRSDPSLGGVCLYANLETVTTKYRQTTAGAVVMITFVITYRARI